MNNKQLFMKVLGIGKAKKTYPTGNPNFAVMQAFPAAFPAEQTDPMLMCDYFGPVESKGSAKSEDEFPVPWHPHTGMDICTYLKQGVGRHADSMGNRGTFKTPGMQWVSLIVSGICQQFGPLTRTQLRKISVGNGIEHAEGGATPKGDMEEGFQLWFNTPSASKKLNPSYGTVEPGSLPVVQINGNDSDTVIGKATLLAGHYNDTISGPFKTAQPIQVIDFEFSSSSTSSSHTHSIPEDLDQCILFVYGGSGTINDIAVEKNHVLKLVASSPARSVLFSTTSTGDYLKVMLFAGKQIKEPIVWHGPFVGNTDADINKAIMDYRSGRFPPVRTPFDYKKWSEFPEDKKSNGK